MSKPIKRVKEMENGEGFTGSPYKLPEKEKYNDFYNLVAENTNAGTKRQAEHVEITPSSNGGSTPTANEEETNYYDMLKNEEYKALLDREIQLGNARERALKTTNASLAAMGFDSAGYGQTAKSGIENQYLQAFGQAENDYQNNLTNINLQEQQDVAAQKEASYARLGEALASAEDYEDMQKLMSSFGLVDDEGNFNYDTAVQMYGEENAKYLQLAYENQNANLNVAGASSYSEARASFKDQNGETGKFNDELNVIYNDMSLITQATGYVPKNGDVIKVSSNSESNASYCYLMYKNGQWIQVSEKSYNSAKNKHWFRSAKNSNINYYFDDGLLKINYSGKLMP